MRQSKSVADVEAAIPRAVRILSESGRSNEIVSLLHASASRSIPETCLLVELLESKGKFKDAKEILLGEIDHAVDHAEKADVDDSTLLGLQVLLERLISIHVRHQDWSAVVKALEYRLRLSTKGGEQYFRRLIRFLVLDGRLEDALKQVRDWQVAHGPSVGLKLRECELLRQLGQSTESIDVLQLAIKKAPQNLILCQELANVYQQQSRFEDAEKIYWKLFINARSLPEKLELSRKLATVVASSRQMSALVSRLRKKCKENPHEISFLLALAEVYHAAGKLEKSIDALSAASRLNTGGFQAKLKIAELQSDRGNWRQATASIEGLLSQDKSGDLRRRLASMYFRNRQTKKGLQVLNQVKLSPNARNNERLVLSILESGALKVASQFLDKCLTKDPQDFRIAYLKAITLQSMGFSEAAGQQYLTLIHNQREIPGLGPSQFPILKKNERYRKLLPAAAFELIALSTMEYPAKDNILSLKNSCEGSFAIRSFNLRLPNSSHQCRLLALAHLKATVNSMDGDSRNKLSDSLEMHNGKLILDPDTRLFDFSKKTFPVFSKIIQGMNHCSHCVPWMFPHRLCRRKLL